MKQVTVKDSSGIYCIYTGEVMAIEFNDQSNFVTIRKDNKLIALFNTPISAEIAELPK